MIRNRYAVYEVRLLGVDGVELAELEKFYNESHAINFIRGHDPDESLVVGIDLETGRPIE